MKHITEIHYDYTDRHTVEAIAFDLVTVETYAGEGADMAEAKLDLEKKIIKAREA